MRDDDLAAAAVGAVAALAVLLVVVPGIPRAVARARRTALGPTRLLAAPLARVREAGAVLVARRCASALLGAMSALLAVAAPARAVPAPEAVAAGAARSAGAAPLTLARTGPHATVATAFVVVRRGDTLWDIARRHLPAGASDAQVARAWPRWYAANRAVIGSDPALIRPGQRLRVPDARPTGTSSSQHHRSPSVDDAAASFDPDRR